MAQWKKLKNVLQLSAKKKPKKSLPESGSRIYISGIFDMITLDHLEQFKTCKKFAENAYLIVGVIGDTNLSTPCIMNEQERSSSIKEVKWVDEVICPCPELLNLQVLQELKIDYVAADEKELSDPKYADLINSGKIIKITTIPLLPSNEIIARIVENRDELVKAYLDKGYSRHELGVGLVDEYTIKSKYKIKALQHKFERFLSAVSIEVNQIKKAHYKKKLAILLKRKSKEFTQKFIDAFDETSENFEAILRKFFEFKAENEN